MNFGLVFKDFEPEFKKTLLASVVFHISIALVFTVKAVFFPTEIPEYVPTMKVDIVGLPEKRTPEEKISPLSEPKTEPTSTKKDPPLQKNKTKDILDNFKREQKNKDILEKFKKRISDSQKPATKTIAGNQVSPGTSLRGLDKIDFDNYVGSVDSHVKAYWVLPEWMLSQNLTAVVNIKIDRNGQIIEKIFVKKSGNKSFDDYVEAALEKANPLPPPPDRLSDLVALRGITFGFPE